MISSTRWHTRRNGDSLSMTNRKIQYFIYQQAILTHIFYKLSSIGIILWLPMGWKYQQDRSSLSVHLICSLPLKASNWVKLFHCFGYNTSVVCISSGHSNASISHKEYFATLTANFSFE